MKPKKWSKEEIKKLIELYPDVENEIIAKEFNVNITCIENKSCRLKLLKSPAFKSRMIAKRNKMVGRDLTFELLKEIALKYKTRGEFQFGDASAYTTARINGFLSEICKHMTVMKFSIPQLILKDIMDSLLKSKSIYNDRQKIKPYEIDVFYPQFKLAFEYQGKAWHKENKKDYIKLKILKTMGISIIYIIENNRRYEEDIKNQIIFYIKDINKICNTLITEKDILEHVIGNIYLELYNKEELVNIAKKYNSFKEFIKIEKKVYYKLSKMKMLDEATEHMKDRRRPYTRTQIENIIKQYINLGDLIKNNNNVYNYIKKNKLEYLISHLHSKFKRLDFTLDDIKQKIKQYTTKIMFRKENKQMYDFLKSKKMTYLLSELISYAKT